MGLGILFGLFYGITSFGLPLILGWTVGIATGEESTNSLLSFNQSENNFLNLSQVLQSLIILPIFAIIQGIVYFFGKYMTEWVGNRVVADLRQKLFSHIHSLPMEFFSRNRAGELISRLTSDTLALTRLTSNVLADAIRSPFTLIGSIAVLVWVNWELAVIAIMLLPICLFPIFAISRKIKNASKKNQESIGEILSVSQETISGSIIIKAFQTEESESNRFKIFNNNIFKMTMKQVRGISLSEPFMTFVSSIGICVVLIYVFNNKLPISVLTAFAAALVNMYKPFKKMSLLHMQVSKALPSIDRIFEILEQKNDIKDKPNSIEFLSIIETIEFRKVNFSYGEKTVLNDISFSTNSGECTAFVGSSGAGKTTLVNLLPRFYDILSGEILLNQKNINDYSIASLRKQISIVTQKTILFNRSVYENIKYGLKDANKNSIIEAAKRANAHDFIMNLENKYDTVIGDQAALLSGGMAQRLAIARALLRNSPILILDEATSALDNESERLVQEALQELMKNRTVFVIAHRLSTIKNADQIIVLDNGNIIEKGTHKELILKGNKYKNLYDMQFIA